MSETPKLIAQIEQLKSEQPCHARLLGSLIDTMIKRGKEFDGDFAFISDEEFDTFKNVYFSLTELADKGHDKSDTEFPQDTLILMAKALWPVIDRVGDRFKVS